MNRPSFQFYTKDWRSNSKLRRCSPAARGVWVDILCALHDSDEYGVARYLLKELCNEVGASMSHVRELVEKGVLKGDDKDLAEPFIYVPRSGRKDGPPVTLVAPQAGPIWYSSRMVRDEYVRTIRGEGSRFGDDEGDSPKPPKKAAPKPPLSDGSSIASASAEEKENPPAARVPPATKGSRLPKDWMPDAAQVSFAREHGVEVVRELERFRDYWAAQPGQKGVKADWTATWRNWVRKAADMPRRGPMPPQADAFAGAT